MALINEHFLKLQNNYLFSDIAKKVNSFKVTHPKKKIIRMGIGDVTQPLAPAVIEAMLKARKESGLTQKQLSERTGIAQTDISKLERGNANPSLRTLQRLAAGMGMKVKIEFVPASAK